MKAPVRRIARCTLTLCTAASMVALVAPNAAKAACHIVAFEASSQSVQVNESAGQVTLTVELVGGQPTCSGTVDYQTVNGTAVSGQDYTARQGTLSFTAGDDRKESFSIPILDDTADEPAQRFTVRLSNGTGSLTADETPATVTIADNDPAAQPTSSSPAAKPTRSATTSPAAKPASASPTAAATSASPAAAATSASPTPEDTIQAAPAATSGGSRAGLVLGILAGIAALAGGGLWLKRR